MLILVADDDVETYTLVSSILQGAGHTTAVARDALQVVTVANQRAPAVIVLDIQMPAGTGVAALERLKRSTRTAHIPVIVLSGTADPPTVEQVRKMGAVDYLSKPVDPDALLDAVRKAAAGS